MEPAEITGKAAGETGDLPAYLVFDTESIPDGRLLSLVKYPQENLSPEAAIERAQAEARALSSTGSDFLPVSFQYPISVCMLRVDRNLEIQEIKCLDAPLFRPPKIVEDFWRGLCHYQEKANVCLVSFNGRSFDLPLLELAAFRYGCSAPYYFRNSRKRYIELKLDLLEWLTNYGSLRPLGVKLDLFAKLLGKPGKMGIAGDQVYAMYQAGKLQEINDYCMFDTLDTYFVFLRTRLLEGHITLKQERELVDKAREWLAQKAADCPALQNYLDNWGDWVPWP
jgi:predicted PolB exonuclease-like 3'-5' exonuclease